MGQSRHMTEPAAVAAVRAAISAIPPAERTPNAILKRLTRSGYPIGKARMMRLIEAHGLDQAPPAPPRQIIALADFERRAETAVQVLKKPEPRDTLALLEHVARALLATAGAALEDVEIENAQQVALLANTAANLIKVIAVAHDVLRSLEPVRESGGSAVRVSPISREEMLAKYGRHHPARTQQPRQD